MLIIPEKDHLKTDVAIGNGGHRESMHRPPALSTVVRYGLGGAGQQARQMWGVMCGLGIGIQLATRFPYALPKANINNPAQYGRPLNVYSYIVKFHVLSNLFVP